MDGLTQVLESFMHGNLPPQQMVESAFVAVMIALVVCIFFIQVEQSSAWIKYVVYTILFTVLILAVWWLWSDLRAAIATAVLVVLIAFVYMSIHSDAKRKKLTSSQLERKLLEPLD